MNVSPSSCSLAHDEIQVQHSDVFQPWSEMYGSTCASSGSSSPCTSDNEDYFHLRKNSSEQRVKTSHAFAELLAGLEVKNSFLHFPVSAFELEPRLSTRRRSQSVPASQSGGDTKRTHRDCEFLSSTSPTTSPRGTNEGFDSLPSTPLSTMEAPILKLSDLLTHTPEQTSAPRWLVPDQTQATWMLMSFAVIENVAVSHVPSSEPAVASDDYGDTDSSEQGKAMTISVGSTRHYLGTCQPCAFVRKKGCQNGAECKFCHICGPEVRRRRQLDRLDQKRKEYRLKKKVEAQALKEKA